MYNKNIYFDKFIWDNITGPNETTIFELWIDQSLRVPNACFHVYTREQDQVWMRWAIYNRHYIFHFAREYREKCANFRCNHQEILEMPELHDWFQQNSVFPEKRLSESGEAYLSTLRAHPLETNVIRPLGLDGYSFYATIIDTSKEPRNYCCWCYLPREWKLLGKLIQELVLVAGLEERDYGPHYESRMLDTITK